jgi:hypothetical protein
MALLKALSACGGYPVSGALPQFAHWIPCPSLPALL